jgi:hypothetical protein
MSLEEFIARHGLEEIDQRTGNGPRIPIELCPDEEDDEDEIRFFVNDARTVGLAVNETKELVRVAYAGLGLADTDWIPLAEALETSTFE